MFTTLTLAMVLFASTNLDDIFVLVGFFADVRFRTREIVIGQYLGIVILVAVSVAASLFSSILPRPYIGLLAIIPIGIGVKSLLDVVRSGAGKHTGSAIKRSGKGLKQVVTVAGITIANGGDNLGIYTPTFAIQSKMGLTVFALVFAVMTGVWCLFARWIVNHPKLGIPIRRYGHIAASAVLIALGVMVMVQAHSLGLLQDLARYIMLRLT